ncbi:helix-turn-helix domain-containing protein (plasmid) [Aliisedimentitalea scapharcae]|uniref:Helix-turn-helix domain-containing protein n=1 Tax=Aliisedimentitalea scapharcae TaxID=1524259 RepID=A0ABZ2Y206_9RHOB
MYDQAVAPFSGRSSSIGLHKVSILVQSSNSNAAIGACTELLEAANELTGQDFYRVKISAGLDQLRGVSSGGRNQTLILFGQSSERWQASPEIRSPLRSKLPCFHRIGLVGGAVFLLQDLPGLSQREVTVHPRLEFAARESRFAVCSDPGPVWQDGHVHSAFGGIAAMHMILALVAEDLGAFVAQSVAADVGLTLDTRARALSEQSKYLRQAEGSPLLLRGLEMMQDNIDTPIPGRSLALALAVSPRQLERSFRCKFGETPMTVYRNIRLEHAHQLLYQTDLPIMEVCVASGFTSNSNFSHWYRERYGQKPTEARKLRYTGVAG